jgi:diguanylate cyclase (GGDEF)-like protein
MAKTDALTQLMNRYTFHEKFADEIERQRRYSTHLSIAMIDIDHFKKLNDEHGHIIVDEVLKKFAMILKNILRKVDAICRFGGDEFVILLPHKNLTEATNVMNRIRVLIEKTTFTHIEKNITITVSAGVTEWNSTDTMDTALTRVDKLLYKAKNTGRNKVVSDQ